jgi:ribosomal protein L37AE/L43A
MDALYHFLILFILSIAVLLLRRPRPVALLLVIPVLTEILQFFMPGRTPALKDAIYGYLGILAGYCLVQLWREISPTAKKVRLYTKRLSLLSQNLICPSCQGVEIRRLTRKLWMRLIPGSRLYLCRNCNRQFSHYSGRNRIVTGFLALVMLFKANQ